MRSLQEEWDDLLLNPGELGELESAVPVELSAGELGVELSAGELM